MAMGSPIDDQEEYLPPTKSQKETTIEDLEVLKQQKLGKSKEALKGVWHVETKGFGRGHQPLWNQSRNHKIVQKLQNSRAILPKIKFLRHQTESLIDT